MEIFGYFRFPVLELSKKDMESISKNEEFDDIMNETWFCHTPTLSGKPCGYFNPCRYTREEGLGRRVPKTTKAGYIKYREERKIIALHKKLRKD